MNVVNIEGKKTVPLRTTCFFVSFRITNENYFRFISFSQENFDDWFSHLKNNSHENDVLGEKISDFFPGPWHYHHKDEIENNLETYPSVTKAECRYYCELFDFADCKIMQNS